MLEGFLLQLKGASPRDRDALMDGIDMDDRLPSHPAHIKTRDILDVRSSDLDGRGCAGEGMTFIGVFSW